MHCNVIQNIITPQSGLGLAIPVFFVLPFFCGHLPQTSSFHSAKLMLIASFTTQARACIHTIVNNILPTLLTRMHKESLESMQMGAVTGT